MNWTDVNNAILRLLLLKSYKELPLRKTPHNSTSFVHTVPCYYQTELESTSMEVIWSAEGILDSQEEENVGFPQRLWNW